jgi:hypothetical protein
MRGLKEKLQEWAADNFKSVQYPNIRRVGAQKRDLSTDLMLFPIKSAWELMKFCVQAVGFVIAIALLWFAWGVLTG